MRKALYFLCVIFIFAYVSADVTSAQNQQNAQGKMNKSKEWSVEHPKAQDFNSFPSPDETSVDLSRLQKAKSLREIYELANGMHIGSVSDQRVLTKAVDDYMKKCCIDHDLAMKELATAGFKIISDITESAQKQPDKHFAQDIEFDKAVFSEFRAHTKILSWVPGVTFYKVYIFFNKSKIIKVNAYIFQYELF